MTKLTTSVLLPVYGRDDPVHLAASLDSLYAQTRPADEIVLVKDGPLTPALDRVIESAGQKPGQVLHIVALAENLGISQALNAGLRRCSGELVIRMDADDIAFPERLERQVSFMAAHPEIDLLGTTMAEFEEDPGSHRIKPAPETHAEICQQLAWRNPINHPTVCIRRHCLPPSGYPALKFVEDYFLWVQMIAAGARCHNLQTPLLYYRFSAATLKRRGGWVNFRNEIKVRLWLYRQGMIGLPRLAGVVTVQACLRFSPVWLRAFLWDRTRRKVISAP
ncbi:MAG: glycosyltransferase [Pseudomonadota bacterium]